MALIRSRSRTKSLESPEWASSRAELAEWQENHRSFIEHELQALSTVQRYAVKLLQQQEDGKWLREIVSEEKTTALYQVFDNPPETLDDLVLHVQSHKYPGDFVHFHVVGHYLGGNPHRQSLPLAATLGFDFTQAEGAWGTGGLRPHSAPSIMAQTIQENFATLL